MEEKKLNLFEIPAFSFIPPKYKETVKERAGKIFGAILICFIILAAINAIRTGVVMKEAANEIVKNCPEFSLKGGHFEIAKPFSFDDGKQLLLIDDSYETVSEEDLKYLLYEENYNTVLIVCRNAFGICSNGRIRVYNYSDFGDFTFSKDSLTNKIMPTITTIAVIGILCFSIVQVGFFYLMACIMQLFVMMFASIFKRDIPAEYRFKMTVLAKLPVHVFVFLIGLFSIHINMWINLLLQILYIGLVVYFYDKDKEIAEETTEPEIPVNYNTEV